MPTIGETLRKQRQAKGVSLREAAEATKISINFLSALESDDIRILPKGIFPKLFIKSYAAYLELDESPLLDQLGEVELDIEETLPGSLPAPLPPTPRKKRAQFSLLAPLVSLFAILAVLGTTAYFFFFSHPAPPPVSSSASVTPVPEPTPTPTPPQKEAGISPTPTPAPLPSGSFDVSIKASAPCWVSAIPTQGSELSFVLNPGDTFEHRFDGPIRLKLGNAGGVTLLLNGKETKPLGAPGQVISFPVSADNLKDFLHPQE